MTDATDVALEKAERAFNLHYHGDEFAQRNERWRTGFKAAIEAYQAALPKGELAERLEDWAAFLETDQGNGCSPRAIDEASTLLRAAASLLGGGSRSELAETCLNEAAAREEPGVEDSLVLLLRKVAAALGGGVPEGWQPIETAPKDGTPVWLWDGLGVTLAAYDTVDYGEGDGPADCWLARNIITGDEEYIECPTHWHPHFIPARPPQSGRE